MPCNLALTIQVVGLEDEALLRMLTPQLTLEAVKAALEDLGLKTNTNWQNASEELVRVYAEKGYAIYTITVEDGVVDVNGANAGTARQIGEAVGAAMRQLAIALLGQNVAATLRELSGGVEPEVGVVEAEQDGKLFPVQVLTVSW